MQQFVNDIVFAYTIITFDCNYFNLNVKYSQDRHTAEGLALQN